MSDSPTVGQLPLFFRRIIGLFVLTQPAIHNPAQQLGHALVSVVSYVLKFMVNVIRQANGAFLVVTSVGMRARHGC